MLALSALQRKPTDFLHDTGASRVLLSGKSLVADPTGALYWPAENTLVVADLQLSNCSYLEGEDVLLPPYDTASAFEKLEEALDRYDPARVVALGNSFAGITSDGLSPHRSDWLQDMMEGRDWYWVVSHDYGAPPERIGGTVVPQMMLGGIKFRADAVRAHVANEIAGGLHPVAQVSQYGHLVRGRCFVGNGMRLILPSMGNYSSGANVLGSAFDPLLGQGGLFVWFISQDRVHPVAPPQLVEDQAA
ncbi:MAG: phosphoesterase [Rhodomicrobium sp.]|nr:phosphoesterase [Rhodomicrobium sp.]